MIDRKRNARIRAGTLGYILTETGNPVSCRVIDQTPDGARLFVDSVFGIPNAFRLVDQSNGESHSASVVWWGPRELGVAFIDTTDVATLSPAVDSRAMPPGPEDSPGPDLPAGAAWRQLH